MIYIVTSGSYSDYGIIAAFTNKEKAKRFVFHYNSTNPYDDAGIEEFEDGPNDALLPWNCEMYVGEEEDGSVRVRLDLRDSKDRTINHVETRSWEVWGSRSSEKRVRRTVYTVTVRAEDKDAATKAAAEMINRFRATTPGAV